ncbi:MAG TPA: hypothetical protein VF272_03300, partial [Candidatus Saccharimonadia bacterium]
PVVAVAASPGRGGAVPQPVAGGVGGGVLPATGSGLDWIIATLLALASGFWYRWRQANTA